MAKGSEKTDHLLVEECLAGREEAWREFYARFIGLMRSVVRRRSDMSRTDVEDICQTAFLELTTALQSYRPGNSLSGLVCMVTERVLIDEVRKWKAAKRDARTEAVEHHDEAGEGTTMLQSDLDSQDRELEKAEEARDLKRALDSIDYGCKELIELRYYHELPFNEIARKLGESENTVTVRTRRCLDKLRSAYNDPNQKGTSR
jgi:RNA polymerase sigma-70 factor, ECF subfamily